MIRNAHIEDAQNIASIYNHYVKHTCITFEIEPVSADEIARRIEECGSNALPWLVAENDGQLIGYCYATKWKSRSAYRYSVEATVYLDPNATAKGWGSALYQALLEQLKSRGIHAVICGIALPNAASVALHEKFGMQKVAHFNEVGRKFDQWVDVGYWQCLLQS